MASESRDIVETWRRPVAWAKGHPFAVDTTIAVVLTVVALAVHAGSPHFDTTDPVHDPTWWTPVLVVAATLPLMYRRRRPIAVLVVIAAAQIVCELVDVVGADWIGLLLATYSVGAHCDGRPRLRAIVGVGVAMGVLLALGVVGAEVTVVDAIAATCMLTAAFVLGDNVRRRRLHVDSLADRAERAEREREILARERVAEERARIARELHDIVAHSVSVMVIQASRGPSQPDRPTRGRRGPPREHRAHRPPDDGRAAPGARRAAQRRRWRRPGGGTGAAGPDHHRPARARRRRRRR